MPIITAWVYNNNFRVSLKEYTGFRYVLYTSDGVLPSYDNTHPFEFVCKEKINNFEEDISLIEKGTHIIQYDASVIGNIKSTFDGKISNSNNLTILSGNAYRKGLNKNQFPLKPSARYNGECVNNAVICEFKQNNIIIGKINVSIHLLLNKFGLDNINAWDGNSIQINQDGGYILSPQMGAGTKDNNNRFTGVLMGQVKTAGKQEPDTGLLGYHQGERSFFLSSTNGSGIFGKAGKGQIIVDPTQNKALLYSGNFWKNYDASKGLPTKYDASNYNGAGLLVDLTTPQIVFGNGNFKVDEHGWLTAKGGGSIAGWTIGTTTLSSKNGTITLNSDSSAITFKNSSGKMYSGSHNGLKSAVAGFYISDDGLSIGSKFKVTSDGTLEIGNGATTSSSKHWTINGDSARSYISYGDSLYDKYFIAANINTTNKNQVYIGTDGISLGRRFSVGANGNLIARSGQIANWTINTNSLTCGGSSSNDNIQPWDQGDGLYINNTGVYIGTGGLRIGSNFQVTSGGLLYCQNATIKGTVRATSGYFNNGTFNRGTFNTITVQNNSMLKDVIINGALNLNGGRADWKPINVLTEVTTKKLYITFPCPTGAFTRDQNGNPTGVEVRNYITNKDFVVALHRRYVPLTVLTQVGNSYDDNDYDYNYYDSTSWSY